jgi:hypothetical protein
MQSLMFGEKTQFQGSYNSNVRICENERRSTLDREVGRAFSTCGGLAIMLGTISANFANL